jgi:hypothetical protein
MCDSLVVGKTTRNMNMNRAPDFRGGVPCSVHELSAIFTVVCGNYQPFASGMAQYVSNYI